MYLIFAVLIFDVIHLILPLERLILPARISRQISGILRMFSKWRGKACTNDENSFYIYALYMYMYTYTCIRNISVSFFRIRKRGTLFWKKVKVSPFCNVLSRKINNYRSMNVFIWKYQLLYMHTHFLSQYKRCCTAS